MNFKLYDKEPNLARFASQNIFLKSDFSLLIFGYFHLFSHPQPQGETILPFLPANFLPANKVFKL